MTIDRYFVIVHPIRSMEFRTPRLALFVSVAIWAGRWRHMASWNLISLVIPLSPVHVPLIRYVKLWVKCRERFPRHRLQRKPLVSDPGMHHGTCVTHVPCCMSGSLTCGGGENVPGIPGACASHNFTYLARGPCCQFFVYPPIRIMVIWADRHWHTKSKTKYPQFSCRCFQRSLEEK